MSRNKMISKPSSRWGARQKKAFLNLMIISTLLIFNTCSSNLSSYLPAKVGNNKKYKFLEKTNNKDALNIIYNNTEQKNLLNEFSPERISCAKYDFSGIKITYVIAKYKTADDAFGIYSGLTSKPRERLKLEDGEISYKTPYFAGIKNVYVFWFWSPSNPSTYAPFYKQSAKEILQKINSSNKDYKLSYHWKILPVENRVNDSIFYIKSRIIDGYNFKDAYAAEYQTGNIIGKIYIQKFISESEAVKGYENFKAHVLSKKKRIVSFENFKLHTYYWTGKDGFYIVHRYKWIMFYLEGVSDLIQARNLVSIMYFNMQKMRGEVLKSD